MRVASRPRIKRSCVVVGLVTALSASSPASLPMEARAQSAPVERIVFARFDAARPGLYSVRPNGSRLKRLTDRRDSAPSWSPDGDRIAFRRWQQRTRSYALFVAQGSGAEITRIVPDVWGPPARDFVWSPDGTRLAYMFSPTRGDADVGVVEIASGTRWIIEDARDPDWSPDGARIAFSAPRPDLPECGDEIYTSLPDGSDRVRVTDAPSAADRTPRWSPDGIRIAFTSSRDHDADDDPASCEDTWGMNTAEEIYVVPAQGGQEVRVTDHATYKLWHAWSPGGSHIAYESVCSIDRCFTHNRHDIFVVASDGGKHRNLTGTKARAEEKPVWSPDGSMLVFAAEGAKGRRRIETVDVTSGERSVVFRSRRGDLGDPDWR